MPEHADRLISDPMVARDRSTETVLAWVESRSSIRDYADLRPVLAAAVIVSLLAGWVYGAAILVGYFVWFLVTVPPLLRLVRDIVTVIEPAALVAPEGLDDIPLMAAMLDELLDVPAKNRGSRLVGFASEAFTVDGHPRRTQCPDGHTATCEHRASREGARMWGLIGAESL